MTRALLRVEVLADGARVVEPLVPGAERLVDEGRAMELRYVEGEPRDLRIRHEVHDASVEGASVLFTTVSFDALSLGFLAKYFLKHHPEIRFGVFPGSALTLSDAVLRAVR